MNSLVLHHKHLKRISPLKSMVGEKVRVPSKDVILALPSGIFCSMMLPSHENQRNYFVSQHLFSPINNLDSLLNIGEIFLEHLWLHKDHL